MDDATLRQHVRDELDWQPHVRSAEIAVTADRGVVRLTGYVATHADKVAAEHAVKRVAGVRGVVLESLEVRVDEDAAAADDELAMRARTSLSWTALVPDGRVDVAVENGHITLTGQLDWHFQRAAADNAVRNLAGVAGVANEITLRAQPQPTDVRSQIERALRRSADLDARFVRVTVVDGSVTLEGAVGSWSARERAEDAAWMAPGVNTVRDLLMIA
jgi:osmotically-inducible protein OsmY